MTPQPQHTPTPWAATYRKQVDEWWIGAKNADPLLKIPISQMTCAIKSMSGNSPQEAAANAAFIVRACNAHDELVGALEGLLDQLTAIGIPDWHGAEGLSLGRARNALDLAQAKGE